MVDSLGGIGPLGPPASAGVSPARAVTQGFGEILERAMGNLAAESAQSQALIESFAAGGPVDVSQVAIAMEQASLAMSLAIEVRNQVIEAYNTLLRMPV